MNHASPSLRVGIFGGGLAGLAAAAALSDCGAETELLEAKRKLGGRAGSFVDPQTGDEIDHCQHVAMGCCTNFADFCRRTGVDHLFQRHRRLHFLDPQGEQYDLQAASWLPAPLHLAPSFLRIGYLSWRERLGIGRALFRMARTGEHEGAGRLTIGQWLKRQRQSTRAMERFWAVVLVSALGESLDRASYTAARKVFVDGFLRHREAYVVDTPAKPLAEIYDQYVANSLTKRGVCIHRGLALANLVGDEAGVHGAVLSDGQRREFDFYIVALPWRPVAKVVPAPMNKRLACWPYLAKIDSAPITAAHLWFDRPITTLPHAVLIDRLSQWVFHRPNQLLHSRHYYQVVISASRNLSGRNRAEVIEEILDDLRGAFPQMKDARLLHWKLLTEREAVFSERPGLAEIRPSQTTPFPNLMLAGDWTQTGWPATMEGAVRSGYLAAEAVTTAIGAPRRFLAPDLPKSWLVKFSVR